MTSDREAKLREHAWGGPAYAEARVHYDEVVERVNQGDLQAFGELMTAASALLFVSAIR